MVRFQLRPREAGAGEGVGDVRGDHLKHRRAADHAQTLAQVEPRLLLQAAELDPINSGSPEDLARFLGEAQRLPREARVSLAALIRREHGQALPELVEAAYPPGSERRRRLGDALVRHAGGVAAGVSALALESLLSQTLLGFGDPHAPAAAPQPPRAADLASPRPSRWRDIALAILVPRRRAAVQALARLEGKVELARVLLATVATRGARSRFELEQAADLLEKALLKVGLAKELFGDDAHWPRLAPRAVLARREVAELRPVLWQLHEVLSRPAQRRAAVRPTPGEIGDIDRAAAVARESLSIVVAMGELLGELDAEPMHGPLTPGDLQVLGLAFSPEAPPPQALWDDDMVDALLRLRREPVTARRPSRVSLPARSGPVRGADLLTALRVSGFDLAHVDPAQIAPAARYITGAQTVAARSERFAKVEGALRVLGQAERPVWSRERMVGRLTDIIGVPERALLRLPDAEVFHCFQEIARALNTGSGLAHVKVGRHRLALTTDASGRVVRSSCRKRGKGAGLLNRTVPLALTALRHTPLLAPLGRLLARPGSASESLHKRALLHLTHLGSDLLGAGAALPFQEAAARAAVVWSFHSAERAGEAARRLLASGLAAFDPSAIARANKELEQAEEARRAALRDFATDLLHRVLPASAWAPPTAERPPAPSLAPAFPKAPRPSTTGASLRALVKELRQTRMLVERVQQIAAETTDLAQRPDVPEAIREAAAVSAANVEQAMTRFRQELGDAHGETATEAARVGLEGRIIQIFADYQQLHIALTTSGGPKPSLQP